MKQLGLGAIVTRHTKTEVQYRMAICAKAVQLGKSKESGIGLFSEVLIGHDHFQNDSVWLEMLETAYYAAWDYLQNFCPSGWHIRETEGELVVYD